MNPYIATSKDGKHIPVPCGKCIDCRKDYQKEWTFRLSQEMRRCRVPVFITLTYNDENVPLGDVDGEPQTVLVKSDLQKFFKRLRKNGGDLLKEMRYFAIGEYGSKTNRCHFHAVIMAPNLVYVKDLDTVVKKSWTFGFSLCKFCTDKQVHYVCKYMNKLDSRPHLVKPFRLYSRSIGLNYLTQKVIDYYLSTFDRTCLNGSCRIGLPRYYKRKLDALSDNNYYLKKSGLKYSDLLEDIRCVEGTKYYFFKYFSEHYEELYKQASCHCCVGRDVFGDDVTIALKRPTPQQVWNVFRNSQKYLVDLLKESDRVINECRIRNRLIGLQPITQEYLEAI